KLETLKEEKEGPDGKLAGLLKASKDLDNLIESQRSDKIKDGLGYSVVPPLPAQHYLSPKKDLSWTADCTEVKTNKVETIRKSSVKYAEMYRRTTKKPNVRGNQRNWNNLKSHQLGPNFVMKKKACFNCGDFNHLAYDCRKMRPQYRAPWVPTVNKNFPPVNRKLTTSNSNVSTICCCCSRHVNTARPKAVIDRRNWVNDVKASACWVWKPIKSNSASIILKRYDYVDCNLPGSGFSFLLAVAYLFTSNGKFFCKWELDNVQWECLVHFIPNNPPLNLMLQLQFSF
nr:ubiquitin hydrolase [Tanacetum cinerariifolium]